jgi:hypothetical protein
MPQVLSGRLGERGIPADAGEGAREVKREWTVELSLNHTGTYYVEAESQADAEKQAIVEMLRSINRGYIDVEDATTPPDTYRLMNGQTIELSVADAFKCHIDGEIWVTNGHIAFLADGEMPDDLPDRRYGSNKDAVQSVPANLIDVKVCHKWPNGKRAYLATNGLKVVVGEKYAPLLEGLTTKGVAQETGEKVVVGLLNDRPVVMVMPLYPDWIDWSGAEEVEGKEQATTPEQARGEESTNAY